jgi:hypothetical protein
MGNVEIKQLGGKFVVLEKKPVAVWLVNDDNVMELFLLTKAGYTDLEKLVENNQNV